MALCRGLIEASPVSLSLGPLLRFPWLYAAASLKRLSPLRRYLTMDGFPWLYAAASLKLLYRIRGNRHGTGFPWLYAAASLKHVGCTIMHSAPHEFSVALCRGLIEAVSPESRWRGSERVFRGFMPRPH